MAAEAHTDDAVEEHYYWPNRLGRMYLLALEDVLGKNGLNASLHHSGLRHRISNYPPENLDLGWSFEEMGALNQALADIYERQEAKERGTSAGRVWFSYASKDFGAVLGIGDLAFRLLPLGMKIKLGLNALADTFNKTSDQIVRVEEQEDHFLYHVDRCPVCWHRTADVPICYPDLGLLLEGLHWVTGGKNVQVEEIRCIAKGDPSCTYILDKRPNE